MLIKSWIKMGFRLIKVILIIILISLVTTNVSNKEEFEVKNFHLNRSFDLTAYALKEEEEVPVPLKVVNTTSKYQRTGNLTGYAADCPLCNGHLACKRSYNVYKNNVVTYNDEDYGEVRIVASSKNLLCGSIIRFKSSRVSKEDTYAIVLDRGVLGNNIDLLVPSESYASKYIGRSKITYDVLREGW